MRHRVKKHSFGRKPAARKALMKGLVNSLVEHGRIRTTLPKAKELRGQVERAITMGKKGTVHARRQLDSKYANNTTVKTIVDDLAVRFKTRPGGYTRIIKLGARPGDKAEMAFIEFVDYKLPDVSEATAVQGDKEAIKKARLAVKKKAAAKKARRKMQEASRKINRGKSPK